MFRFPLIWHRFTKYNITFCRFLFWINDLHYKNKSKVKKKYFFQLREGFYWEMCDNNFRGQVWSYLLKSKITEKLAPLHVFFIIWGKSQLTREDLICALCLGSHNFVNGVRFNLPFVCNYCGKRINLPPLNIFRG